MQRYLKNMDYAHKMKGVCLIRNCHKEEVIPQTPNTELETDHFYSIEAIHTCSSDSVGTSIANLGGQVIFVP